MSNVSKLRKKAADLEQKKQFDRAVQAYIELLDALANDIDDSDIPLYNRVGDILIRQNSPTEALVYYEKAVDLYSERGFLNNAIALCNKILRQSPGRTVIYYKLGKISASKGFKSDAKRNFLEYADRMEKGGKRDEAFRALKEFADLCPDQDDVRLMLAEHLARDNRREEAIEQLQTLHAKLETEGRQAEARATLDRMKAIDPDVAPRPSGSYQRIKSNELIFLDVDDLPNPHVRQTPTESVPSSRAPQPELSDDIDIAGIPALAGSDSGLDALGLTIVPEEATEDPASAELIDGFTHTGEQERITPDAVVPIDDFVTGRTEPADVDVTYPSLIDLPVVEEEEVSAVAGERIELESFADETMTETEFAALDLESLDAPLEERPHDLALPSVLPLMRFTGEVPIIIEEPPAPAEAETPETLDLNDEIMAPISRSEAPPTTIDDTAFDLAEEVGAEEQDEAAAAFDVAAMDGEAPNEQPEPIAHIEWDLPPAAIQDGPEPASAATHSLEWEDLAAAAAAHDVEPLERPALPSSDAPADAAPEPELDPHFLDRAPTFGEAEVSGESDFTPMPLSPETLEPDLVVGSEHRAPIAEVAGASPDAIADDPAPADARPQPRVVEARALVSALRELVEATPNDPWLRRRLAEALLETGERERGLRELDAAMQGVEQEGDIDAAREIAKEFLRLVPDSVRHHQKCVEYAVRSGERGLLIDAYAALADALFRSGEHDKARAVYGRVVELEPNEPRAVQALEMLAGRAPSEETLPSETQLPATPAAESAESAEEDGDPSFGDFEFEDLDAEVAAAFQSSDENGDGSGFHEAHGKHDGEGGGGFTTPAFVAGTSDFIDLGALLRGDQPAKSTRMVVDDVTPTGDEQADFDDMLRRFKQGVDANVDDEDFDSHYDLGVAFKEMGLIDEAIAQFQKALRSDGHRSRAYEALGQCFVEKSQFNVAVTLLARAVATTRVDDRVLIGSLYLLAYACEQLQQDREALVYYHRVFAVDSDFRDVATRIRALESQAVT